MAKELKYYSHPLEDRMVASSQELRSLAAGLLEKEAELCRVKARFNQQEAEIGNHEVKIDDQKATIGNLESKNQSLDMMTVL